MLEKIINCCYYVQLHVVLRKKKEYALKFTYKMQTNIVIEQKKHQRKFLCLLRIFFFLITDEIIKMIVYLVIPKLFNLTSNRSRVFKHLRSHHYLEENLTWIKPLDYTQETSDYTQETSSTQEACFLAHY